MTKATKFLKIKTSSTRFCDFPNFISHHSFFPCSSSSSSSGSRLLLLLRLHVNFSLFDCHCQHLIERNTILHQRFLRSEAKGEEGLSFGSDSDEDAEAMEKLIVFGSDEQKEKREEEDGRRRLGKEEESSSSSSASSSSSSTTSRSQKDVLWASKWRRTEKREAAEISEDTEKDEGGREDQKQKQRGVEAVFRHQTNIYVFENMDLMEHMKTLVSTQNADIGAWLHICHRLRRAVFRLSPGELVLVISSLAAVRHIDRELLNLLFEELLTKSCCYLRSEEVIVLFQSLTKLRIGGGGGGGREVTANDEEEEKKEKEAEEKGKEKRLASKQQQADGFLDVILNFQKRLVLNRVAEFSPKQLVIVLLCLKELKGLSFSFLISIFDFLYSALPSLSPSSLVDLSSIILWAMDQIFPNPTDYHPITYENIVLQHLCRRRGGFFRRQDESTGQITSFGDSSWLEELQHFRDLSRIVEALREAVRLQLHLSTFQEISRLLYVFVLFDHSVALVEAFKHRGKSLFQRREEDDAELAVADTLNFNASKTDFHELLLFRIPIQSLYESRELSSDCYIQLSTSIALMSAVFPTTSFSKRPPLYNDYVGALSFGVLNYFCYFGLQAYVHLLENLAYRLKFENHYLYDRIRHSTLEQLHGNNNPILVCRLFSIFLTQHPLISLPLLYDKSSFLVEAVESLSLAILKSEESRRRRRCLSILILLKELLTPNSKKRSDNDDFHFTSPITSTAYPSLWHYTHISAYTEPPAMFLESKYKQPRKLRKMLTNLHRLLHKLI